MKISDELLYNTAIDVTNANRSFCKTETKEHARVVCVQKKHELFVQCIVRDAGPGKAVCKI